MCHHHLTQKADKKGSSIGDIDDDKLVNNNVKLYFAVAKQKEYSRTEISLIAFVPMFLYTFLQSFSF